MRKALRAGNWFIEWGMGDRMGVLNDIYFIGLRYEIKLLWILRVGGVKNVWIIAVWFWAGLARGKVERPLFEILKNINIQFFKLYKL